MAAIPVVPMAVMIAPVGHVVADGSPDQCSQEGEGDPVMVVAQTAPDESAHEAAKDHVLRRTLSVPVILLSVMGGGRHPAVFVFMVVLMDDDSAFPLMGFVARRMPMIGQRGLGQGNDGRCEQRDKDNVLHDVASLVGVPPQLDTASLNAA